MRFIQLHWFTGHQAKRSAQRRQHTRRRLVVEGLEDRRLMATFEVTTVNDIYDLTDSQLSFREAVVAANANVGADRIVFASSIAQNGPESILLIDSMTITGPVEIEGPSLNQLTLDAGHRSRIFQIGDRDVANLFEVKLSNLKLTGGKGDLGGAILSSETLIMIGCTITDSSAESGGAVFNAGILNVWESNLSNNRATLSGGAIDSRGTLSIVDTTLAGNTAEASGGSIYLDAGTAYFVLINSTIAGNIAKVQGGGIATPGGMVVRMTNTIVAGNTLSNGSSNDISGFAQTEASYSLIGAVGTSGWVNGFRSSIVGIDWKTVLENDGTRPLLKNNGGRSETIAILPDSPALDTGYNATFTNLATRTDQRGKGFSRWVRRNIDVGAFERPKESTAISLAPSSTRYTDGSVTYSAKVKASDGISQLPTGIVTLRFYRNVGVESGFDHRFAGLVDGVATFTYSEENLGVYRVEASYSGDDTFKPSEAPSFQRTARLVDYGDAPSAAQSGFSNSYPVTLDQDGARHSRIGLSLGAAISDEVDGVPNAKADLDTNDDGVTALFPLIVSTVATTSSFRIAVPFNPNGSKYDGKLDAWIDFNRDGDWNDAGEKIYDSTAVSSGNTSIRFTIPSGAAIGATGARFRVSTAGGLKPTGATYDGEVEDYLVTLSSDVGTMAVLDSQASALVSEIITVDGDVIVKSSNQVLFQAPRDKAIRFELDGTALAASTKWLINNLEVSTSGKFVVELGAVSDRVRLSGAGQTITLSKRTTLMPDHGYAQIDIRGTGDNTLILTAGLPRTRIYVDRGDQVKCDWLQLTMPEVIEGQFVHRFNPLSQLLQSSSVEIVTPSPFQNPRNAFDSDLDNVIAPSDILAVINALGRNGSRELVAPTVIDPLTWRYTDINGDNFISPLDALLLINELRRLSIPIPNFGSSGSSGSSYGVSGSIDLIRHGSSGTLELHGSYSNINYNGYSWTLFEGPFMGNNGSGMGIQTPIITRKFYGSLTVQDSPVGNLSGISVRGYGITIEVSTFN